MIGVEGEIMAAVATAAEEEEEEEEEAELDPSHHGDRSQEEGKQTEACAAATEHEPPSPGPSCTSMGTSASTATFSASGSCSSRSSRSCSATAIGASGGQPSAISPWMLGAIVVSLTLGGTALTVLTKLMTMPMAPYTAALTLASVFGYVPIALVYALARWATGSLDPATLRFNWRELVAVSAVFAVGQYMMILGTQYTSGPMQVLLAQAAIPFSMGISRVMMKATYRRRHYVGALLVFVGILISVGGGLGHEGSIDTFQGLWILGYTACWAPIALWTVYGELLYKRNDAVDPVILTGVVSLIQLPFLLLLAPVFTFTCRPQVPLQELPQNLLDGFRCLVGVDSQPGDDCALSPTFVSSVSVLNVLLLFPSFALLQHGSSNLLWLACTLIVPASSLGFSLPFIPGHVPATPANGLALIVICGGLATYGFSKKVAASGLQRLRQHSEQHLTRMAGLLPGSLAATASSSAAEEEERGGEEEGGGGNASGVHKDGRGDKAGRPVSVSSCLRRFLRRPSGPAHPVQRQASGGGDLEMQQQQQQHQQQQHQQQRQQV